MQDDVVRIDGAAPVSAALVETLQSLCDRVEDGPGTGLTTIYISGTPAHGWTGELTVGLTTKWERALRRLERLPAPTVAVVSGDCGGPALDALLATDFRVATPETRLIMALDGDATWPSMALFRLGRQGGGAVRRAALLGAPLDAARALALGLFDEVTDDPGPVLLDLAELAEGLAGQELAIRRQLLADAARTSFEEALGSHLAACDRMLRRGAGR
ncbi:enoyl-CoA hydratase/isomerase family protein [Plantactinospora sp. S1510]|uniref:Enoyl-CoA hydratase/isomerase family protein n=1 Tax=Plantactinospora alkalitolerans TaxID=2789879 RepID=A0ABS0GTF5_9ACTN|nr:enoyl-CoA-hydratase DpgB [Plantactinospora alkalitolerans]MBF9129476.1 enoyl-CoA hydratase/isomerase family protein [Plantactinospora alkalitolerans]